MGFLAADNKASDFSQGLFTIGCVIGFVVGVILVAPRIKQKNRPARADRGRRE